MDAWFETYNTARPHHSYGTRGRTLLRAFADGLAAQREEVTYVYTFLQASLVFGLLYYLSRQKVMLLHTPAK